MNAQKHESNLTPIAERFCENCYSYRPQRQFESSGKLRMYCDVCRARNPKLRSKEAKS